MIGDCPSCDSNETLESAGTITLHDEYGDTRIVQERLFFCTCCGKTCRVSESGKIVVERDVMGRIIDGQ